MTARRAIALLFSCSVLCPSARAQHPNVVLVTIDTLRADRIGVYGAAHAGTPNLDRLAAEGLLFENAFAHSPVTLSSHASLLTGRLPYEHGVRSNSFYRLPDSEVTLAEILSQSGFESAAFIAAAPLDSRFGLDAGFDLYDDAVAELDGKRLVRERDGASVVEAASMWLKERGRRPYFLWVHLFEPHHPYAPPEPFRSRFADALYDGEVAYSDHLVGELLAGVDRAKTLIVVTSDHGESLGEHGEETHGVFVYDATLHVPLILAGPGVERGRRRDLVGLVDAMPMVLALAGVDAPTDAKVHASSGFVYAESYTPRDFYGWSPLHAIRTTGYKYVAAPTPELYALEADPFELRNRAESEPAVARELSRRLAELRGSGASDARYTPGPELLSDLQSLGYVGAVESSASSARRVDPKDKIEIVRALDLAVSAVVSERYDDAFERLGAILDDDPENILATHYMADVLFALGRDADAIRAYRAAIARGRDAVPYHERLAELYERAGRHADAARETRWLIERSPKRASGALKTARALLDRGEPRSALSYLTIMQELGIRDPALALLSAEARAAEGELDVALEILARAREASPEHATLHSAEVELLKRLAATEGQSGNLKRAAELFTRAHAAAPDDFEALADLALTHLQLGNQSDALTYLTRALELRPAELRLLNLKAEILFRAGRLEESRALLKRSLELDASQPLIREALAEVEANLARRRQ